MRSKFLAFAEFTTSSFNLLTEVCDRLKELGVTIEVSKDGTKWRYS